MLWTGLTSEINIPIFKFALVQVQKFVGDKEMLFPVWTYNILSKPISFFGWNLFSYFPHTQSMTFSSEAHQFVVDLQIS